MGVLTDKRLRRIEQRQDAIKNATDHQAVGLKNATIEAHKFLLFAMINKTTAGEVDAADLAVMRTEYGGVKVHIAEIQQVLMDLEALIDATGDELTALISSHSVKRGFDYNAYSNDFGL